DARDGLAVELLLAVRAPRLEDRVLGVAQEGEGEGLGLGELRELVDLVDRDADDAVAGALEAREGVAEVAGLGGASGRAGGRVEVDDDALAAQVRQGEGRAVGGWEREVGGEVTRGEARHVEVLWSRGCATSLVAPV